VYTTLAYTHKQACKHAHAHTYNTYTFGTLASPRPLTRNIRSLRESNGFVDRSPSIFLTNAALTTCQVHHYTPQGSLIAWALGRFLCLSFTRARARAHAHAHAHTHRKKEIWDPQVTFTAVPYGLRVHCVSKQNDFEHRILHLCLSHQQRHPTVQGGNKYIIIIL